MPNCQRFLAGAGVARVVWPEGELSYAPGRGLGLAEFAA